MIDAAEAGRATHTLGVVARVGRFVRCHPEWWVVLGAAGAWGMMVARPHPGGGHHHGHSPVAGPGVIATAVMIVAMMLPLTIPSIRHAACSGPRRRHRAILGFVCGYVAVWMVAMLAIAAAWGLAASLAGWTAAAVGAVAAAALWQATPLRQRQARRCHREMPLAPEGWRADAECARYGATSGIACVGMCWALMVVCVAFSHSVPVMAVLFGVQLSERYRPRVAPALAALAVLGTGLAALAARLAAGHVA